MNNNSCVFVYICYEYENDTHIFMTFLSFLSPFLSQQLFTSFYWEYRNIFRTVAVQENIIPQTRSRAEPIESPRPHAINNI